MIVFVGGKKDCVSRRVLADIVRERNVVVRKHQPVQMKLTINRKGARQAKAGAQQQRGDNPFPAISLAKHSEQNRTSDATDQKTPQHQLHVVEIVRLEDENVGN